MATALERIKLPQRRPLPPELLIEMHKFLPNEQQVDLLVSVPSRVIVLNNGRRVRRALIFIKLEKTHRKCMHLAVENFNNSVSKSTYPELTNKYRAELLQDIQERYEYLKKFYKAKADKDEAEEKECQRKAEMAKIEGELDELKKDKEANRKKIAEMEKEFARAKEESAKAKNEAERAKRNLESALADLEQE